MGKSKDNWQVASGFVTNLIEVKYIYKRLNRILITYKIL
jgi:hypothetical protein